MAEFDDETQYEGGSTAVMEAPTPNGQPGWRPGQVIMPTDLGPRPSPETFVPQTTTATVIPPPNLAQIQQTMDAQYMRGVQETMANVRNAQEMKAAESAVASARRYLADRNYELEIKAGVPPQEAGFNYIRRVTTSGMNPTAISNVMPAPAPSMVTMGGVQGVVSGRQGNWRPLPNAAGNKDIQPKALEITLPDGTKKPVIYSPQTGHFVEVKPPSNPQEAVIKKQLTALGSIEAGYARQMAKLQRDYAAAQAQQDPSAMKSIEARVNVLEDQRAANQKRIKQLSSGTAEPSGQKRNITEDEYNRLNRGDAYWWNGQQLHKK